MRTARLGAATLAVTVLVIRSAANAPDDGPIVSVTGGRIQGARLAAGAVFKGVPYARAPVGELRWRDPQPPEPWTATREATAFGPPCPQIDAPIGGFAGNAPKVAREDCLFLNVWTPAWPVTTRLPVMLWIHGGGNYAGAGASDLYGDGSANTYDGERLAGRGVVVVTINYRVGPLGFLAHPELTAESPHRTSGNYGLLDQIAALRWVQNNIARFGGDPGRVTLFGQSSGATDIGVLMTSPLAKGLFHRAIAESGTLNNNPRMLDQAEADGITFAAALGAPQNQAISYLRRLNVTQLVNPPVPLVPAVQPRSSVSIRHLLIDGYAIPASPAETFASGREHAVPLIIGSNARERSPSIVSLPTDLPSTLRQMYGPLADRAIALYTNAPSDPLHGPPAEQWAGDSGFRCDSVLEALWHTQAGHAAFQYEFGHAAPGRESIGAIHSAELWYVFGSLALGTAPSGPKPRYGTGDRAVSDFVQQYWTNFAKTGDPNDGKLPRWPRFTTTTRPYLEILERPVAGERLRGIFCDLSIENVQRSMNAERDQPRR